MMTEQSRPNTEQEYAVRAQEATGKADGPGAHSTDRLAPLAFLLILMAALTQIIRLDLGSLSAPGPGLWPMIVAIMVAVLLIATVFVGRDRPEPVSKEVVVKVGITLALLAAFPLLYEFVGFIPTGAVAAGVFAWYIGHEKILASVLLAVGSSIAVYLLFGVLLDLRVSPFG